MKPNLTEADFRVAATFIDCEGWIGIARGTGYNRKREKYLRYNCTVRSGMTDRAYIDWLQECFGGGIYFRKSQTNKWKDQYHWSLGSTNLREFLKVILPYLKIKRKQAELALEYLDRLQDNDPAWRESVCKQMNALNRKGKPVTTNTPDCTETVRKIESELTGDRESEPAVTQDEALASLPA